MKDCSIIITEDDSEDRFILQQAFEDVGFEDYVTFINSGDELLLFLQTLEKANYPNLIVLDMNMPRLNGRETLEILKDNATVQSIPVVMFSTSRNEPEVKACQEIGALSYIEKPNIYAEYKTMAKNFADFCSGNYSFPPF